MVLYHHSRLFELGDFHIPVEHSEVAVDGVRLVIFEGQPLWCGDVLRELAEITVVVDLVQGFVEFDDLVQDSQEVFGFLEGEVLVAVQCRCQVELQHLVEQGEVPGQHLDETDNTRVVVKVVPANVG